MIGPRILPVNTSGGPLAALPDGATLLLDFTNGRAIEQNIVTSLDAVLNCDRAGPGSISTQGGGVLNFAANELRHSKRGLLVEESRTNFLLNSFVPATQTVALVAGAYVLSVIGAGSATLTGDATGVATEATVVAFTVGSSGSVTVTVAGQMSSFQLENGSFPTSPIATGGASAARLLDNISFVDTSWLDPQNCTFLIEWEQVAPGTGVQTFVRWDKTNYHRLRSGNAAQVQVKDTAGNLVLNRGSSPTPPPLGVHRVATALAIDDMAVAWSASITGTAGFATDQSGTPEAAPGTIRLGSNGSGEALNGWLRRVVYWPERLADAEVTLLVLNSSEI